MLKFADHAEDFSEASSLDEVANLQSDLDKLHRWSEDWHMLLNAQKLKCLHIGHKNTNANCSIGGDEVTNSSYERDLGVVIEEYFNYNRQCAKAVLSANKIKGIINRTNSCKSKDDILNEKHCTRNKSTMNYANYVSKTPKQSMETKSNVKKTSIKGKVDKHWKHRH